MNQGRNATDDLSVRLSLFCNACAAESGPLITLHTPEIRWPCEWTKPKLVTQRCMG
jgi:hypothetical protein